MLFDNAGREAPLCVAGWAGVLGAVQQQGSSSAAAVQHECSSSAAAAAPPRDRSSPKNTKPHATAAQICLFDTSNNVSKLHTHQKPMSLLR